MHSIGVRFGQSAATTRSIGSGLQWRLPLGAFRVPPLIYCSSGSCLGAASGNVRELPLAIPTPLRSFLVIVAGVAVYYVLLGLLYANAPYATIPHWLQQLAPTSSAAIITWFTLLNAGGAILAALPAAVLVVLGAHRRRIPLALIIGVLPATCILVGSLVEFGAPLGASVWAVAILQFLVVSLAVVAAVVLFGGRSLTNAWSGRES